MDILLINSPHPSIGSRIPCEHLPPLGLLSVGGPLVDAGHQVRLLDAEFGPISTKQIVEQAVALAPQAILVGHSGSTSGHPIVAEITRALRAALAKTWIIYGGVFPTYHWEEILAEESQIDVIVRGEGEETVTRVIHALETNAALETVPGIAYREQGVPFATPPAPLIRDLDAYRVGWELIDHSRYSYWGNRRAVVVQFSRGCPHSCSYCGQRTFWTRWRHRDPRKFAAEIAWLYRVHGVEVINLADENPTASRRAWRAFLEALIAENVPLTLVGSTRADDIVRDADILPLYKRAGVARFLLGIESYDEKTLRKISKGGTTAKDREAIRLLRQHDILSMATYVVGFEEEMDRDYVRGLKQLLSYDPDQIQMVYVTPHRWTPYFRTAAERRVIQTDQRKWDYKHQVLATRYTPPWRVLLWVKFMEAVMQLRPRSLWRLLSHHDLSIRAAMRWYYQIGRRVWPFEIWSFLFRDRHQKDGPTLAEFWGAPQSGEEIRESHTRLRPLPTSPTGGYMSKKQWASRLMLSGGIAEIVVAFLHFLMPLQLGRAREIVELSHDYRSFVLLATIAIGLCMVVFGGLSIYFSNKLLLGEESAWIFGLSQGALWVGRTIFELVLPVRIPLFFLPNPTVLIVALATSLALLFLVPPLAFRAQLLTKA